MFSSCSSAVSNMEDGYESFDLFEKEGVDKMSLYHPSRRYKQKKLRGKKFSKRTTSPSKRTLKHVLRTSDSSDASDSEDESMTMKKKKRVTSPKKGRPCLTTINPSNNNSNSFHNRSAISNKKCVALPASAKENGGQFICTMATESGQRKVSVSFTIFELNC